MRLLLLLLPICLCATTIKEKFTSAQIGDFIVTQHNKTSTLLRVADKTDTTIQFEEISIPANKAKKLDWRTWLTNGAKGNTSWILYTYSLETGRLTEAYSHTKLAHLALDTTDSFLSTLSNIKLTPIPPADRKKIGPPPPPGEADFRKEWTPPKIVDGVSHKRSSFAIMGALWPKDGSEIAGKRIELYFADDFPFPYWLHVTDDAHTFQVRAIDSGRNLTISHKKLPERVPEFFPDITPIGTDLRFTIKGSYSSYILFAMDISTSPTRSFALTPKTHYEAPLCHLDIPAEELEANCIRGHTYVFYASPREKPELLIESPQTYLHN